MKHGWGRMVAHGSSRYQNSSVDHVHGANWQEPYYCRASREANQIGRRAGMPKVKVNGITMNYDQQGTSEPLILIPYLTADYACYAFQVAEYAKHYTCISVDLRGTGETDKPEGAYSTEVLADDIAAFMQALGLQKAHISGLSLGAAIGYENVAEFNEKMLQFLKRHTG